MKKLFGAISMLLLMPLALAYDSGSPYSVTVSWSVPSDTTFSVALASPCAQVNFLPADKDTNEVEAECQDVATGVPILTMTNQGNVNLTFKASLTATMPSYVVLKGKSTGIYAGADTITDGLTTINSSIVAGDTADEYLWADFNTAVGGNGTRTLQVSDVEG